jgi:hypothetical protein
MKRYQIRTPQGWTIEDVIEEMAGKGWDAIKDQLDFSDCRSTLKIYRRFQHSLHRSLVPQLRAFRLCGIDEVCLDLVESAPLADRVDMFGVSPWDFICHLFLPVNLEDFLNEVTREGIDAVQELVKTGKKEMAFDSLRKVLKDVLGDYIYWNPVCGKAEICTRSTPIPVCPTDVSVPEGRVDAKVS